MDVVKKIHAATTGVLETGLTSDFKKYIKDITIYLRNVTGHSEYMITFRWDTTKVPDGVDTSTMATIAINHTYLYATITIHMALYEYWKQRDYRYIAHAMTHEVSHLFFEPITDMFMWDVQPSQKRNSVDTVERQVQRVANTITALLGVGWWKKFLPSKLNKRKTK